MFYLYFFFILLKLAIRSFFFFVPSFLTICNSHNCYKTLLRRKKINTNVLEIYKQNLCACIVIIIISTVVFIVTDRGWEVTDCFGTFCYGECKRAEIPEK